MNKISVNEIKNNYKGYKLRLKIFHVIRDLIFVGYYKPNEIITEVNISNMFNCSRTPVREAIKSLENIGLVKTEAGIGLKVSNIDEKAVNHEFEIRNLLEVYAIKKTCQNITDEKLHKLKNINSNILYYIENENFFAATLENEKFHDLIFEFSDNDILLTIKEMLWVSLRLSFLASHINEESLNAKKWDYQRHQEHNEIIDALESRNEEKAILIIEQHIHQTYQYGLNFLKQKLHDTEGDV